MRPVKNSAYGWRIVPSEEACTIVVVPPPPMAVRNVTVRNFHSMSSRSLSFDVMWLPNEDTVTSYEVLVTQGNVTDSQASKSDYSQMVEVGAVRIMSY